METCFAEAERLNSWQPPDSTAFNRAVPSAPIYPGSHPKKKPKIHPKTKKQQPIKRGGKIKEANPMFCILSRKGRV
jgi:hypothetical protein